MMKKLIGTIALCTLVHCAFADTTTKHSDIKISATQVIATKNTHDENKDAHYIIDAVYPQLSGTNLDASAQEFNQKLNDLVTNTITQFKMQIVNPTGSSIPAEALKNTLNIDYTTNVVHANNQVIVSVRLNELAYFAGTAHPMHTIDVFNYNLSTGKEIQLTDLFKSDSNFLDVISSYCNKDLKTKLQNADGSMIDQGTTADAKNYANWNLKANGLLITFNEYQVAAYVNGMPEVLIPYSALQPVIAPDSPFVACAKNASACK